MWRALGQAAENRAAHVPLAEVGDTSEEGMEAARAFATREPSCEVGAANAASGMAAFLGAFSGPLGMGGEEAQASPQAQPKRRRPFPSGPSSGAEPHAKRDRRDPEAAPQTLRVHMLRTTSPARDSSSAGRQTGLDASPPNQEELDWAFRGANPLRMADPSSGAHPHAEAMEYVILASEMAYLVREASQAATANPKWVCNDHIGVNLEAMLASLKVLAKLVLPGERDQQPEPDEITPTPPE